MQENLESPIASPLHAVQDRPNTYVRLVVIGRLTSLSLDRSQPLPVRPPLDDEHRGLHVEVGVHDLGDVGAEAVALRSFADRSGSDRASGDLRLARPLRFGALDGVDRGAVQGEPRIATKIRTLTRVRHRAKDQLAIRISALRRAIHQPELREQPELVVVGVVGNDLPVTHSRDIREAKINRCSRWCNVAVLRREGTVWVPVKRPSTATVSPVSTVCSTIARASGIARLNVSRYARKRSRPRT